MSFFSYKGKNVFYETIGEGKPLVFLHGNTSSSKLFMPILPLYNDFQVILIDFLGYGQSDRLDKFPTELWKDEARQTVALLEHLNIREANLVGTSGAAWVAINAAFLRPDLIATVTATVLTVGRFTRALMKPYWQNLVQTKRISRLRNIIIGVSVTIGKKLSNRIQTPCGG